MGTYQEDRGMVVHVEEAELLPFLRQNNENSVHEVQHLGAVEDIKHESHRGQAVSSDVSDEFVARKERIAVLVGDH